MRTLPCLALLAALGLRSAAAQQRPPRPLEGFDAYVANAMMDWRVPGLAIVVVKDDSVVFIKGYGVRELGKPDPVTVHTRFGNMSTTKAFTALLVAMLADSGKLSFDDPVTRYEPGLQLADPYVTRELTVRDLLTHRIGFGDPDYLWDNSGLEFSDMVRRLRLVLPTASFPDARTLQAAGVTDVSAPHGIVRDTVRVLPVDADVVDPIAPAGAAFS